MAKLRAFTAKEIQDLRSQLMRNAPEAATRLSALLSAKPASALALAEWHALLLFTEAHAANAAVRAMAQRGLAGIAAVVSSHPNWHDRLQDSGLLGASGTGLYSLTLVRWMLQHWPGCISLQGVYAPADEVHALIRPLLTANQQEALDLLAHDTGAMLEALFTADPHRQISGLVGLLSHERVPWALSESLFARLQVYVHLPKGLAEWSLTCLRAPSGKAFLFTEAPIREVDAPRIIAEPVAPPLRLTPSDERGLIAAARTVLALMQREIDPVTYAHAAESFDLGRGLRIALFHADADHRLSLESYVGSVAFRNGVPLGYGGAWVFPGRTKVGINVFPFMRGGESAWFFAQLLRLYRHRFGITCFEAENYQLGHGNADGLRSGAYWFYYRLGFRPWNAPLTALAADEHARMAKDRSYRPALRTMKRLVADGLVLRLAEGGAPETDTAALVMAVQRTALSRHGEQPRTAAGIAMGRIAQLLPLGDPRGWTAAERAAVERWAPAIDALPEAPRWPIAERRRVAQAIRAKAARTETRHQAILLRCPRLLQALARLADPV
jgi:hypothetical protein